MLWVCKKYICYNIKQNLTNWKSPFKNIYSKDESFKANCENFRKIVNLKSYKLNAQRRSLNVNSYYSRYICRQAFSILTFITF